MTNSEITSTKIKCNYTGCAWSDGTYCTGNGTECGRAEKPLEDGVSRVNDRERGKGRKRMKTLNIETTVMILGAVWTVRSATETEEPRLEGVSGFTDWTTRTICLEKNAQGNIGSMETYMNKVIRHEVVHAFMFESGLGDSFEHKDYGQEETIVDWFAFQMGNIVNVVMDIQKAVKWVDDE